MEDHSMEGPGGAQWAPDPYRRHELRYWDGSRWTEHVSEGDGAVLVDPPVPRLGREPAMASSVGLRSVTPVQTPAGFDASAVGLEEKSPDVVPEPARSQRRAARQTGRQDLFNDLAGGRRAAEVDTAAASRADATIGGDDGGLSVDHPDEGWDWRESHLPEILSGLGVAALIACAALLGGRGADQGADAGRSIVTAPASGAAAVATTTAPPKKPKKPMAPEIKVSSAKAPRGTSRSSSSTEPRETTRPTRTTRPPTRSPRPTATNSPSEPPPTTPPSTTPPPPDTPTAEPPTAPATER